MNPPISNLSGDDLFRPVLREIASRIQPITFEPLELDPELEPIGHAVWSELSRPVVPSPRKRPLAVQTSAP